MSDTSSKKLTQKEKIKIVEDLISHYQSLDSNFNNIYSLFGNADSKFTNSIWSAFDGYVDTVCILLGDNFHFLNWYIYENSCGKNQKECTVNKKKKKIKNIVDLLDLIEYSNFK